MSRPFPFDALLFDLDGTLLATDRFWIPAARAGAKRAFEELGLARELPSGDEWMRLVGLPLAEGFDALFADLDAAQRAHVMTRCVEEEHRALEAGGAALLPGVLEALEELRSRGVAMGVASNCSQSYLDSAMQRLHLADFVSEARCLDSRGVRTKSDMVEDLLLTFGTRSAVMVGDRAGDRDAAHANAIPHVHLANGFAPKAERVECEAIVRDFGELLPRLEQRFEWIEGALEALGCFGPRPPRSIGIAGPPASGKTLFARDAVRLLASRGIAARHAELPDPSAVEVKELWRHFGSGPGILLVEGVALLEPLARPFFEHLVHLDAPDALCLARLRTRHLPLGERAAHERAAEELLPLARALERDPRFDPGLLLDGSNPLGPPSSDSAPRPLARGGALPSAPPGA